MTEEEKKSHREKEKKQRSDVRKVQLKKNECGCKIKFS